MDNKSLEKNIAQSFIMSRYLSKLCKAIGSEAYLKSYIRLEHGTGTGFFGISNSGSTDCVKERFRAITDSLGQKFDNWHNIDYISEGCLGMTVRDSKVHRVEHTREVIDMFLAFEREFIIPGKDFTPADLGAWLLENQVVCLILQSEQKSQKHYDDNIPFSKYSAKIYYQGTDISNYTLAQLKEFNHTRFSSEISAIQNNDFTCAVDLQEVNLLKKTKKHTLPPMSVAVSHYNNEFALLKEHYHHKLNKRSDPKQPKYYNKIAVDSYHQWLSANNF